MRRSGSRDEVEGGPHLEGEEQGGADGRDQRASGRGSRNEVVHETKWFMRRRGSETK